VSEASGLTCSVGVSGDKTTAKFAAKLQKPDGLTVISPWEAEARLADEAVIELSGINKGIAGFLASYGVRRCGDMKKIPVSIPARRFGNLGRRIWLMAQGRDPEPVITTIKAPKTIGHGKVMPPQTRDRETILTYLQHMSEKVGARLRRHRFQSARFFIGLKTENGWLGTKAKLHESTADGTVIFNLCREFFGRSWRGQGVWQVQVTALDPVDVCQPDLFEECDDKLRREALNRAVDQINERYGEFTVAPSRLIGRSAMPNVIAPAWKPSGHRKSI
jgi:DNA polymerase-4